MIDQVALGVAYSAVCPVSTCVGSRANRSNYKGHTQLLSGCIYWRCGRASINMRRTFHKSSYVDP